MVGLQQLDWKFGLLYLHKGNGMANNCLTRVGPSTLQLLPIHLMEFMVRTLVKRWRKISRCKGFIFKGGTKAKVFIIPSKIWSLLD
jgi:hypothetical protein